jgi:phage terminase large subunit-like protein
MRLMDSYDLDPERVKRSLRAIEGQWQGGRHVKGGLKFSTPRGSQHVRLMPFQAWLIFEIYAFKVDVSMEREYHDGDMLLPTEWVRDGMVWDTRRLTQEAHWFLTRKSGKTELGGAVDFTEVGFLGDVNGQALICTNSSEQSQIAYKAIREFAMQVDPTCSNRMGGKYFRMTRNGLNWQPGHPMKGEIKCMAAGKTSKDGLYASVVHADEHGQAGYVNAHSDMQAAVDTCWGSTGPRREKLLLHTTTAGRIKEGPYKTKIEQVEASLLSEMQYPLGQPHRTPDDYWCAFLLQLDKWELTDDLTKLNDTELFKKVNRSIGTTVQPTYYRERLHEAATGTDDTKQEVLTKDFNMWQQGRITTWMKGDRIRPLQIARRITDCKMVEGWQKVYCGLDFSHGDDLFAMTFLAVNYKAQTSSDIFFADTIAWVLEDVMRDSPNLPLYEQWIEQGWLRKAPGEVFDSMYAINELAAIVEQGINIVFFGYDPAQSIQPINQLKAWLQTLFQKRQDVSAAEIAKTIQKMVVPVPQTMMVQNPRILEIEEMIKRNDPFISFSMSPLWPFCFGNCAVETNESTNLRRIVKGGAAASCKIDPVHALMDAVYLFDLDEGRVEQ